MERWKRREHLNLQPGEGLTVNFAKDNIQRANDGD